MLNRWKLLAILMTTAMLTAWTVPATAASQGSFDSDGVTIQYMEEGEGEPVVLIHGFVANAMLNWVGPGIFDALAEDYRVIAPDNRGHGRSGKPHDPAEYGPKMAQDVINLLDHLEIDRAHIVGYSLGGFITTYMVAKYPDRIISAVPAGAGWSQPGDPRVDLTEEIADSLESGRGIAPLLIALTPTGAPQPTEESLEAMNKMITATNDVLALAAVMRGMKTMTVTAEELAASPVPVCAVIGEVDPLRLSVDQLKRARPATDVVVVTGGDHVSTMSDPAFLKAIQEHLAKHSAFEMTGEAAASGTTTSGD